MLQEPVVFAGSPDGSVVTKQLAMPKNNPIFMEGDTSVDVSKLKCYTVEGSSLAPIGIMDGSLLYVEENLALKDNKELIVSITYKKGSDKDYSFHSAQFLQGIVRYKSLPTSSI